MTIIMEMILVAIAVFIADIIWVLWIRRTAEGKPLSSAIYSVIIYIFAAYVIISYTTNPLLVFPACVGAFTGTYLTVWWDKRREDKEKKKKK